MKVECDLLKMHILNSRATTNKLNKFGLKLKSRNDMVTKKKKKKR